MTRNILWSPKSSQTLLSFSHLLSRSDPVKLTTDGRLGNQSQWKTRSVNKRRNGDVMWASIWINHWKATYTSGSQWQSIQFRDGGRRDSFFTNSTVAFSSLVEATAYHQGRQMETTLHTPKKTHSHHDVTCS